MKHGSTLFLKIVIILFGIAVFAVCAFLLKVLLTEEVGGYGPILIGMLVAAVPFFIGAFETLKLLNYIDAKKAFSQLSVSSLNKIKYCAGTVSLIYGIGMPYIFIVADRDDAPGVVLLGLIFTFAPLSIATFSAVIQKQLKSAIKIKSENDLIV